MERQGKFIAMARRSVGGGGEQAPFLHGHDLKIDHRTLEAQGIDLELQHKIGAVVRNRVLKSDDMLETLVVRALQMNFPRLAEAFGSF